jgi:hypothetical protein
MTDDQDTLKRTIARLRELPQEKLERVSEFLDDMTDDQDIYILSGDERATLEPEIQGALRGEFATEEEVARVLGHLRK